MCGVYAHLGLSVFEFGIVPGNKNELANAPLGELQRSGFADAVGGSSDEHPVLGGGDTAPPRDVLRQTQEETTERRGWQRQRDTPDNLIETDSQRHTHTQTDAHRQTHR